MVWAGALWLALYGTVGFATTQTAEAAATQSHPASDAPQLEEAPPLNLLSKLDYFAVAMHSTAREEFGANDAAFDEALRHAWGVVEEHPTTPTAYLTCGDYATAHVAAEWLRGSGAGFSDVRTLFSSRAQRTSCFLLHRTLSEARALRTELADTDAGLLRFVEPVPAILKLSPSLYESSAADEADTDEDRDYEGVPTMDGRWAHSENHFLTLTFGEQLHRHSLDREPDNTARTTHVAGRLFALKAAGGRVPKDARRRFFWTDDRVQHHLVGTARRAEALTALLDGEGERGRRLDEASTSEGESDAESEAEVEADACQFQRISLRDDRRGHVSVLGHQQLHPEKARRESCLHALLVELATVPDVLRVDINSKPKIHNSAASGIVQSGDGKHPQTHPFWSHGITGTGEIVQVADTGLDQYSCFFYDDDNGAVATTSKSNCKAGSLTTDMDMRKVVQYVEWVDSGDYTSGHGTHVAGSVAGSVKPTWGGLSSSEACDSNNDADGISACTAPNYYSNCDTLISSCKSTYGYGDSSEGFCDQACYCKTGGGYPGAQEQDCESMIWDSSGAAPDAKIAFFDIGDSSGNLDVPSNLDSHMFPAAYDIGARISSHSWGSACASSYRDSDLQVDEYMYDHPEFLILFAAGNEGNYDFSDDDYYGVSNECDDYSISSPAHSKNGFAVGAGQTGRWATYPNGNRDPDMIAYFSSVGMTYDDRYKPDIIAPGFYVMSANADDSNTETCSITYNQGTSMSTPIVAGTAALVRQYFSKGTYLAHAEYVSLSVGSGKNGEVVCLNHYTCENITASAALVKAVMVNSAQAMTKWDQQTQTTLESPPTREQGWGRVSLNASLPLYNLSPRQGGRALFVEDNVTGLVSGEEKNYSWVTLDPSVDFVLTLVWTDPPSSLAASKQLLHDLNLKVVNDGTVYYPNGLSTFDEKNNVEKITVSNPGNLTVVLTAGTLTESDRQPFALVAIGAGVMLHESEELGHFYSDPWWLDKTRDCRNNTAPAAWLGDGKCDRGGAGSVFNGTAIFFNCTAKNMDDGDCAPTLSPSVSPTISHYPTFLPTPAPTVSDHPTSLPTPPPTSSPRPTAAPTLSPTPAPTPTPTKGPGEIQALFDDVIEFFQTDVGKLSGLVGAVMLIGCCFGLCAGMCKPGKKKGAQEEYEQEMSRVQNPVVR